YPCYLVGHLLQGGSVMILGGSKQGYRWLNLGIQVAQNRNIIHFELQNSQLSCKNSVPTAVVRVFYYWGSIRHAYGIHRPVLMIWPLSF
ncbi:MAG: hypothetical protein LHW56_08310, partial [Candidatus Cloacimonetes bacterium]|nr:hypothetical protein [Candidatus Cloacimonadota bacterium]MDY0172896.1 hypothetical protein [Candidatus Cloacimonadaceae bacterium]